MSRGTSTPKGIYIIYAHWLRRVEKRDRPFTFLWPHDVSKPPLTPHSLYTPIHTPWHLHTCHILSMLYHGFSVETGEQMDRFFIITYRGTCLVGGLLPRNSTPIVITWVPPQASTAVIRHRRLGSDLPSFLGWDKMEGKKSYPTTM